MYASIDSYYNYVCILRILPIDSIIIYRITTVMFIIITEGDQINKYNNKFKNVSNI